MRPSPLNRTVTEKDSSTPAPTLHFEQGRVVNGLYFRYVHVAASSTLQNLNRCHIRLYHQILHGCTNPDCNTRTCRSFQQRTAQGPFRPFTVLSARALAAFLASHETAAQHLCPNKPAQGGEEAETQHIGPDSPNPAASRHSNGNGSEKKQSTANGKTVHFEQLIANPQQGMTCDEQPGNSMHGGCAGSSDGSRRTEHLPSTEADATPNLSSPNPVKKDMKSFTQRLFSTAAFESFHNMSAKTATIENDGAPGLCGDQKYNRLPGQLPMSNRPPLNSSTRANQATTAPATLSTTKNLGGVDSLLSLSRALPYRSFIPTWRHLSKIMRMHSNHRPRLISKLRSHLPQVERSRFVFAHSSLQGSSNEGLQPLPDTLGGPDIVQIVNIILAALVASVPICSPHAWAVIQSFHSAGLSYEYHQHHILHEIGMHVMDSLQDDLVLSLTRQLIRLNMVYTARRRIAFSQCPHHLTHEEPCYDTDSNLLDFWMDHRATDDYFNATATVDERIAPHCCRSHSYFTVLELFRTVLMKEWDGKARVPTNGLVAGAADCLQGLCKSFVYHVCHALLNYCADRKAGKTGLQPYHFHVPLLVQRLDMMTMPKEWVG